jgi:hypothetical protein
MKQDVGNIVVQSATSSFRVPATVPARLAKPPVITKARASRRRWR